MKYLIYKVTNNLTSQIYIGMHRTKVLDDGYMGSGKRIRYAIRKHGIENFTKEILFVFDSEDEMKNKEIELVTEDFIKREDTYNLRPGGKGGWSAEELAKGRSLGGSVTCRILNAKHHQRMKNDIEYRTKCSKSLSLAALRNPKGSIALNSEETNIKRKQKFLEIGHAQGSKNSQFGSMWITNETESKKIKNSESIPEGWTKGRKQRSKCRVTGQ